MSAGAITRVRGEAPGLAWPETTIQEQIDWCAELRRLCPDPASLDAPPRVRAAAWALEREWAAARLAAHRRCSSLFGGAQGWAPAKNPFPATRLMRPADRRPGTWPAWQFRGDVFDHAEWFCVGRRAAAAVVHLYGPLALHALPPDIVVDQLPASWYYPGWTTAYVFRPPR